MKINKLQITKGKFDINLKFYFLLKHLVKSKLSEKQALQFLETYVLFKSSKIETCNEKFEGLISQIVGQDKQNILFTIIETLENKVDLDLFAFSLKLYLIKDLLLQEAKLTDVIGVSDLDRLDPLSLSYDKISVYRPYATRVNGALLALLFFSQLEAGKTNFMSSDAHSFINNLSKFAIKLKKNGVEPNQIFMLMFSESINQSIISDSGTDYEDRILSVLTKIGIPEKNIKKVHDKDDSSTEFDFFFELGGRTFGIGAKRTLRERYKQFIKTAQMSKIDVMIEITLGLDLNEEKAKSILNHNIHIFVADEIYCAREFLQKMKGIYSVKDLTLKVLKTLK
jgi:hypothetical protein